MSAQVSLFGDGRQERENAARAEFLEILHALERSRGIPRSAARVTGIALEPRVTVFALVDNRIHSAVDVASVGDAARTVFDTIHGVDR